jgi:hypothetical protein
MTGRREKASSDAAAWTCGGVCVVAHGRVHHGQESSTMALSVGGGAADRSNCEKSSREIARCRSRQRKTGQQILDTCRAKHESRIVVERWEIRTGTTPAGRGKDFPSQRERRGRV